MSMMECSHTYPDWYVVLLTCSNATFVIGRFSKVETIERISAGALGLHPSEHKTPNRGEYNGMSKLSVTAMSSEQGVSDLSIR